MRMIFLSIMMAVMVSSLQAGPADVRSVQPQLALQSGKAGQWYEVTAPLNTAAFSDRRLVVSRLSMNLDLPLGTSLELWASENDEVLPWAEDGALPLDRWTMDARTESFVRFNVQPALSKALSNGQNQLKLYIRVDEHQEEDVTLNLARVSDLAMEVHHRPTVRD